jgi:hypothetical protein
MDTTFVVVAVVSVIVLLVESNGSFGDGKYYHY